MLREECFQVPFGLSVDADLNVPASKTDGVARKLDWRFPAVPNPRSLFLKEQVLPVGRKQKEDSAMKDKLQVRLAPELPPGPHELRDGDAVLGDELLGDRSRVLPLRDNPAHVKPIPPSDAMDGNLLDEAFYRRRFVAVADHCSPCGMKSGDCFNGTISKALNLDERLLRPSGQASSFHSPNSPAWSRLRVGHHAGLPNGNSGMAADAIWPR